jgi:hypothetical protein
MAKRSHISVSELKRNKDFLIMTFLKRNRVCVCECVPLPRTSEQYNIEPSIWAENTEFIGVFRFLWQVLPKDQGSNFPPNKLIILYRVRTYHSVI